MLIQNYGHGGAGMSLSWGTAYMAAELAMEHGERRATVVGCGAVGLTAARQLQRRGFEVTIYAMSVPPDTTSNMSLAGFTPTSGLLEGERRTPEWDAQFRRAAEIAYTQLQLLTRPNYGISWIYSYSPTDEIPGEEDPNDLLPSQLRTGQVVLQPGEHPFPTKYAIRRSSMRIQPSIYLDALVREFLLFGGRIVIRKFDTPRDLMSLSESVIVNCTGLGSKTLFNDEELVPVKGQLSVLVPQPEVDYRVSGPAPSSDRPGGGASANPRSDGIVIGNLMDRGNWSLEPDDEVRRRNVEAATRFFAAMRRPVDGAPLTRSAPPHTALRLESFFTQES